MAAGAYDLDGGLVILTGAGVSRESGLATFRDEDGIWAKVKIEDVATPEAFASHPGRVHDFYNARRRQLLSPVIKPNAAHFALADLERAWRGDFLLVTQNVDDLHERAGSRQILHLHGELFCALCAHCGNEVPCREDLSVQTVCTNCGKAGGMRPRVVWFGEIPLEMERVVARLEECALFVSIGTSGNVYPAAGFAQAARLANAHTVELNLEPSEGATFFKEAFYGPATETVPAFIDQVIASND